MKRWIIIASVVIVCAVLLYALMAWQTAKAPVAEIEIPQTYSVSFEDSVEDGVHTISGTVLADTPCQTLTAEGQVIGGQIRVAITLPPETGVCLQRQTELPFEVTVEAPDEAAVAVFVNETPAAHD
ncbi:MAG TPA: hypothetical protein VEB18_03585 [Candidatus Paceibacterota bacterium]|nr:hypothetical protein [Candidatus Paceibacterota bacterium]